MAARIATSPSRVVLAILTVAVLAVGCQFSDILAFRNTTGQPLTLRVQVTEEFARYDCDGSGSDLARFDDEATVQIAPGQRLCLEGPATDMQEPYDARDYLEWVEISRSDTIRCIDAEGETIDGLFGVDGSYKTLIVDEQACPLDPNLPVVETPGDDGDVAATEAEN